MSLSLYKAYLFPHLEYCSPLLIGINKTLNSKLESANKYALKTPIKRKVIILTMIPRTGSSVGGASGYHTGGREFNSDRTNTQGLKITE